MSRFAVSIYDRLLFLLIQERSRWFMWVPVLFGIGITIYFSLVWQPEEIWLTLPLLFIGLLGFPAIRQRQVLFLIVLACLLVSGGFNAALLRQLIVEAPVLQKKVVSDLIGNVLEKSAGLKKKRLLIGNLTFQKPDMPALSRIRITVRSDISLIKPGQQISLKAVLLPPPAPAYPGAYDFQRDSYFKKIGAVGYSISPVSIVHEENDTSALSLLKGLSARLRDIVNANVLQNAPQDTAGFSLAIMSGDRGALNKTQLDDMRASGLAHLLAISGLHMGMVGGLIFFAVRLFASFFPHIALYYPVKKWAAVIALIGLTGYLMVSGMSVSALRAYLMISMVLSAVCFDRTALSLRNLAFAALLILFFLPESLLTASFQMSFGAVFCLIAVYELYGGALIAASSSGGVIKRILFYLVGICVTSLIASIATAPFSIYHFGQFSVLGILANLAAIPVMGFWVMPWTLISFLTIPFSLSSLPLELAGEGIGLILKIAELVTSIPGAHLNIGTFSPIVLTGLVFGMFWALVWRNHLKWGGIVIVASTIPILFVNQAPDILYADSGNLFLIRLEEEDIRVSTLRADRFEREKWSLMYGGTKFEKISSIEERSPKISCDLSGCVYPRKKQKVAFSNNLFAAKMDCYRADIMFSAVPAPQNCSNPSLVVDKFDLWREGTHALYFNKNGSLRLETVNSVRGDRPWVPERYRKALQSRGS